MADCNEPRGEHRPHLDRRQGLADAHSPRADRTGLKGGDGLGVKARIDGRAQPGGQAVDPVPPFERPQHDRAGGFEPWGDAVMQTHERAIARDRRDRLDLDRLLPENDRRGFPGALRAGCGSEAQFTSPLAFRKAAATVRGSFLSTSTWRLSSCIVGLSSVAPTFSRISTILALAAISGRTTGARK